MHRAAGVPLSMDVAEGRSILSFACSKCIQANLHPTRVHDAAANTGGPPAAAAETGQGAAKDGVGLLQGHAVDGDNGGALSLARQRGGPALARDLVHSQGFACRENPETQVGGVWGGGGHLWLMERWRMLRTVREPPAQDCIRGIQSMNG